MTKPDFSKIFAQNGSIAPLTDVQFLQGFEYLGDNPPTKEEFNGLFQQLCLKLQYLDMQDGLLMWQANKAYAVGDVCLSPTAGNSYKRFECTVGGVSGAAEPVWPAVGQTIVDGAVTWAVRDMRVATALFDNSTKLVTSKFLKQAGLQASSILGIPGAATLTAADCGKIISPYASTNQTITLPLCSACPEGSILTFISNSTAKATLSSQGTDIIVVNANPVGINSLVLNEGDSLILVSSSTKWYAIGGSAQIIAAGSIVSSGAGWTKFADGTMIQTGGIPATASGSYVDVAYPLAFYTTPITAVTTAASAASATVYNWGITQMPTYFRAFVLGSVTIQGSAYIAVGRWKA